MSSVLTLTDGEPPSLVNTYEKVILPKDKHVKLFFFSPVTGHCGGGSCSRRKRASSPWETNLVHVPWLMPLMKAYLQISHFEKARALMEEMKKEGVQPNR